MPKGIGTCFAPLLSFSETGGAIEAHEEDAGPGYQFSVLGRPEEVQKLFRSLNGRIQRALTWRHIVE